MTRFRDSKSVISRLGAKQEILKNIIPLLEQCQYDYGIKTFIDACSGSGKIILNINTNLFDDVIFNELDTGICALFECLKNKKKTSELINTLDTIGYSRGVFDSAIKKLKKVKELSTLEAATSTYIAARQSWTANMKRYNKDGEFDKSYIDKVYRLDEFYEQLSDVEISNRDCKELLTKYQNCIFSLIYVDPPYIPSSMACAETYTKELSWTDDDHKKLVDILLKSKAKIVLSGYDNNNYIYSRLVENGWTKIFLKTVHVSSSGTGRKNGEFVWLNFNVHSSIIDEISEDEEC